MAPMSKLDELVYKVGALEAKAAEAESQRNSVIASMEEVKSVLYQLQATIVRMEGTNSLNHQTNVLHINAMQKTIDKLEPIVTVHEQERQQGQGKKNMVLGTITIIGAASVSALYNWFLGRH